MPTANDDGDGTVHFQGALTVQDAREAVRLARPRLTGVPSIVGVIVLCAFLFLMTVAATEAFLWDEDFLFPMVGMFVIDVTVVVATIAHRASVRRRARQMYANGEGMYAPTEGYASETEIHSRVESAEATLKWTAFCGFRSSPRVAVLYQSFPSKYVVFARTKFRDACDWQQFVAMASAQLPKL